ncbi:MAG: hypothetical protein HQL77_10475 [Magnetococcales bacterium]|nr:hypothetical protein [Magnetococcales bacterium]
MSNPIQPPSFAADQHVQTLDSPQEGQDRTSDEIDIFELWQVLWRQKWLIIFFSILGAASSVLTVMSSPPIYRAEVLMTVAEEQKSVGGGLLAQYGGLASMMGISSTGSTNNSKGTALAILHSRSFSEAFVTDEKISPGAFYKKWDILNQIWKDTDTSNINIKDMANDFRSIFRTADDKKTGMITLTVEWRDREQAAQWANLLVDKINRYMMERTILEATKAVEFLKNEWTKNSAVELQQAVAGLLESQIKMIMLSKMRSDYVFTVIDPAIAPTAHFQPRKRMIFLVGTFAGIFLGIIMAMLRNMVQSKRFK